MRLKGLTQRALVTVFAILPLIAQGHNPGPVRHCPEGNTFRKVNGGYVIDEGTVGYPLRGWVGYTNNGTPVSQMTIECFSRDGKHPVASATTDNAGNFLFPRLKPDTYFLKGTKKETQPGGSTVRVSTDEVMVSVIGTKSDVVACLVAESEADSP